MNTVVRLFVCKLNVIGMQLSLMQQWPQSILYLPQSQSVNETFEFQWNVWMRYVRCIASISSFRIVGNSNCAPFQLHSELFAHWNFNISRHDVINFIINFAWHSNLSEEVKLHPFRSWWIKWNVNHKFLMWITFQIYKYEWIWMNMNENRALIKNWPSNSRKFSTIFQASEAMQSNHVINKCTNEITYTNKLVSSICCSTPKRRKKSNS